METGDKQGRRFHVDRHGTDEAQVSLELLVVFPDARLVVYTVPVQ